MNYISRHPLVLSIYPTTRGYAFVLFEGPESPYDWGVRDIRKRPKNEETLESVHALVDRYHPDYIVIEDFAEKGPRRSSRIRALYRMLLHFAETEHIEVSRIAKKDIRVVFEAVGARTKYEIAQVIARQIPAFTHRLPRLRRLWMSEDPRQGLFDAAAIGITCFGGNRLSVKHGYL